MVSRTNETKRWARVGGTLFTLGATLVGCTGTSNVSGGQAPLVAVCATNPDQVPTSGWRCPDPLTVECVSGDGKANVDTVYVVNGSDGVTCEKDQVTVSDEGPFTVGTHTIVVSGPVGDGGTGELCRADLTVVDTKVPVATTRRVELWPPNHTMHHLVPDDCVRVVDDCDGPLAVRFVSATSDEPEDDIGDGHHVPDIVAACDGIDVRAERQGTGDGRVYRLNWEAHDRGGHSITGSCEVVVPHDRSGREPVESPVALTVEVSDPTACEAQ